MSVQYFKMEIAVHFMVKGMAGDGNDFCKGRPYYWKVMKVNMVH
jgi:hypothetical protein